MLSSKDFENLEKLLDEVIEHSSQDAAVIVEGKKDRKTLRSLGVKGPIHCISSSGTSALNFLENLPSHKRAIILTDFDRKGNELAEFCRKHLKKLGTEPISDLRKKLKSYLHKGLSEIEGLEKFLRSERESVNGKSNLYFKTPALKKVIKNQQPFHDI